MTLLRNHRLGEPLDIDDFEDTPKKPSKKWPQHYNPKPGELDAIWPNVLTETYVEMVFGKLREKGPLTHEQLADETGLAKDKVGVAITDLLIWRRDIGTKTINDSRRVYFAVNDCLTKPDNASTFFQVAR